MLDLPCSIYYPRAWPATGFRATIGSLGGCCAAAAGTPITSCGCCGAGRARYDESRLVHELALLDGPAAYLREHLLHLNIERLGELWRKQQAYALQEARTLHQAGRRTRWRNFAGAPAREFFRRYIALGGWRDGSIGLLMCGTLAYFEIVKFAYLKKLERQ